MYSLTVFNCEKRSSESLEKTVFDHDVPICLSYQVFTNYIFQVNYILIIKYFSSYAKYSRKLHQTILLLVNRR